MRILVVGAGGIGGYFGGRLAAAGRDVTFLVRPKRAESLLLNGLVIRSPLGDAHVTQPKLVTADRLGGSFDLVLLGCKAYDIDDAMASFAPAVGPQTAILPTLNGMAHLDMLERRFGAAAVLGGTCFISATIAPDGAILHMNDTHRLSFGERSGGLSPRIEAIAAIMADAGFQAEASADILQAMWDKWVFIASSAGMTCLMRSAIGDYVAAGASDAALQLVDECASVAAGQGFALGAAALERIRGMMTMAGSAITTSMLRDIEAGGRIEAGQIIGDMIVRSGTRPPILSLVHAHLRAYEIRRAREGGR
ncbi:2-dehydropantoate 2-reductase [Rhizobium sp. GCM10022189]|uniref:2-dehydropantoate 2-reductase n=1 Tax=Rhizobium sp. GCM10022189 TaxID=3252654 RepID=UPI003607E3F7